MAASQHEIDVERKIKKIFFGELSVLSHASAPKELEGTENDIRG
jgi:hypothetical protein